MYIISVNKQIRQTPHVHYFQIQITHRSTLLQFKIQCHIRKASLEVVVRALINIEVS